MTTNMKKDSRPFPAREMGNEEHATVLIEEAITLSQRNATAITRAAARLIAASMHQRPTTALCRFAATGRLDRLQATEELRNAPMGQVPDRWRQAFDLYLQQEALDGAA